ncbi:hypothetical protein FRT60_14740 [Pseudomonas haemolytica]|uniref:Uncharacterized protein n=1 Tax=Pseudomonas haemolytica TaxID=2600065 RepID=A0A646NXX2_9PSED|nr:hypothetical protein [Pseudomonas haemolytica]
MLAKAPVQSTPISRKITPHGQPLVGIGMDSNRSQLKHATIVQIGDAFSAGLSVAGGLIESFHHFAGTHAPQICASLAPRHPAGAVLVLYCTGSYDKAQ